MITERIMPIAMFLFFIMIGINAFITVGGDLITPAGISMNNYIVDGSNSFGSDLNSSAWDINSTSPSSDDTDIGADKSLNPIKMFTDFIGLDTINYATTMLMGVELYMLKFNEMFPAFGAIFLGIVFFTAMIKIIVFAYAGSVLVRAIFGRRI